MLTASSKKELKKNAEKIVKTYNLYNFYFAQMLGNRRHYLAGYRQQNFSDTESLSLTKKIEVFWQGNLTPRSIAAIKEILIPILKKIEKQLNE